MNQNKLNSLAEIMRLCIFRMSNKVNTIAEFGKKVSEIGEWEKVAVDTEISFSIYYCNGWYLVTQGVTQSLYQTRKK